MTPTQLMTKTKRARHIIELATAFSIRIVLIEKAVNSGAGFAPADWHLPLDDQRKLIAIAPVTSEATYAIALHELGHLLAPLGQVTMSQASLQMRLTHKPTTRRDVKLQLQEEDAAWEWAQHYALEWTPRMEAIHRNSFDHYLAAARVLGVTWETST